MEPRIAMIIMFYEEVNMEICKKTIKGTCTVMVFIGLLTFIDRVAFGADEIVLNSKEPAIIKVFGYPVGITAEFEGSFCTVSSSLTKRWNIVVPVGEKA